MYVCLISNKKCHNYSSALICFSAPCRNRAYHYSSCLPCCIAPTHTFQYCMNEATIHSLSAHFNHRCSPPNRTILKRKMKRSSETNGNARANEKCRLLPLLSLRYLTTISMSNCTFKWQWERVALKNGWINVCSYEEF